MYWRTAIATAIGLGTMGNIPCYPIYYIPHYIPLLAFVVPFDFAIAVFTISCGVLLDAAFKYPSPSSTTVFQVAKGAFPTINEMQGIE